MKKIVVSDRLADRGVEYLRSRPGFEVDVAVGLEPSELAKRLDGAHALIIRSGTKVTADLLSGVEGLQVIGRAGIGVDNVDLEAATEKGIVVVNTPDANATTTAELAVAHILSLSRHLPQADRSVRSGEWARSKFVGSELSGKTVGVIGFGTIGRIVASRCLGLQMNVVACDPFVTKEAFEAAGVTPLPFEELLASSDYVTVHCPMNDKTRGLIDGPRIAQMKKGAYLLNCARGGIVDERALIDALDSGQLAGAALDVYENEPPQDSPLLQRDDVVLTPHLGASTREAQAKVADAIVRQVAAYLERGEAINAVNLPPVSSEELARLRPYQLLAQKLGRLLATLAPGAVERLEVAILGRAAELDAKAIAVEALVGILQERMGETVNRVNATHLAKRQGIRMIESRSDEAHGYVSLVRLTAKVEGRDVRLAGTLLDERHPRLVKIDDYDIEAIPEGNMLFTRHEDEPGVIGAIGTMLGESGVNISRMQVGLGGGREAIALLAIGRGLEREEVERIEALGPIREVLQVSL